jgi:hypothetical protein
MFFNQDDIAFTISSLPYYGVSTITRNLIFPDFNVTYGRFALFRLMDGGCPHFGGIYTRAIRPQNSAAAKGSQEPLAAAYFAL